MKRCTYAVVKLCCQLEAVLEHIDKVVLAICCSHFLGTLAHRIALQAPFSDLKTLQMDSLMFFSHRAILFRWFDFFSTGSKIFRLAETFYPESLKKVEIPMGKHIYTSVGRPLWSQNSHKRPLRYRVSTLRAT
jgi:hypothetical protein